MQVSRKFEKKDTERELDTLKLTIEEKIKVLKGTCMEAEIKDNIPMMSGKGLGKKLKFCNIVN